MAKGGSKRWGRIGAARGGSLPGSPKGSSLSLPLGGVHSPPEEPTTTGESIPDGALRRGTRRRRPHRQIDELEFPSERDHPWGGGGAEEGWGKTAGALKGESA